jgi:ribosomal protein S4E
MGRFKNKILLGVTGILLLIGLNYQNCGNINNDANHESSQSNTMDLENQALSGGKPTLSSDGKYTLVLKDGRKVLIEYPQNIKTFHIHLKDGRVIDYKTHTW